MTKSELERQVKDLVMVNMRLRARISELEGAAQIVELERIRDWMLLKNGATKLVAAKEV